MSTLIQCTQKLLTKIPDRLLATASAGERWHANLLQIGRHQCVLFNHDFQYEVVRLQEYLA